DSIAVLPFVNSMRDSDTEYLSDGITEAIINNLSAAPRLKVIARTTVFTFKNRKIEPQIVGRQLGVKAVLMGNVTKRADSIMVQTDLVSVADGSELWGEHFRRDITGLQNLQGDIAREIAEKLRLQMAGEDRKRLTANYTASNE